MGPHDHSVFYSLALCSLQIKKTTETRNASKLCQKANLDGQQASGCSSLVFTRLPDWLVSGLEKDPVLGPVGVAFDVAWRAFEGPLILG